MEGLGFGVGQLLLYQDEPVHEAPELCGGVVIGHVAQTEQRDGQVGEVDLVPAGLHFQRQRTHQIRNLEVGSMHVCMYTGGVNKSIFIVQEMNAGCCKALELCMNVNMYVVYMYVFIHV